MSACNNCKHVLKEAKSFFTDGMRNHIASKSLVLVNNCWLCNNSLNKSKSTISYFFSKLGKKFL